MAFDRDKSKNRKRRKVCQFCVDKCTYIDYKDTAKLRRFLSERSKILPRRTMGAGFCYVPVQLSRCSGIFSTCAMQETITRICGVSTLSR